MKKLLVALALAAPGAAMAYLEPGEWTFTSTVTSTSLKNAHINTYRQCISKAEAGNPRAWFGQRGTTDCQFQSIKGSYETYSWEISCPKAGWKGNGNATVAGKGRTVQAQTRVSNGATRAVSLVDTTTKLSGKRTGPCR